LFWPFDPVAGYFRANRPFNERPWFNRILQEIAAATITKVDKGGGVLSAMMHGSWRNGASALTFHNMADQTAPYG
jgi:hypothetical protein